MKRKYLAFRYKLSLALILLTTLTVGLLGWTQYRASQNLLEQEYDSRIGLLQQAVSNAIRSADTAYYVLEGPVEKDMRSVVEQALADYLRLGDPARMDLQSYVEDYDNFDLYVISRDKVVQWSTDPNQTGLDFKAREGLSAFLDGIFAGDEIVVDRIVSSLIYEGRIKKFAYLPTPDKRYVLEVGVDFSKYTKIISELGTGFKEVINRLIAQNDFLEVVNVYDHTEQAYYSSEGDIVRLPEGNRFYYQQVREIGQTIRVERFNKQKQDAGRKQTARGTAERIAD